LTEEVLHYVKPDAVSLALGHETVPTVTRSVEQDHRRKVASYNGKLVFLVQQQRTGTTWKGMV
jgi:hypothetical protein